MIRHDFLIVLGRLLLKLSLLMQMLCAQYAARMLWTSWRDDFMTPLSLVLGLLWLHR